MPDPSTGSGGLRLAEELLTPMCRHAEKAFPHECCGILVGEAVDGVNIVVEAVPAANLNTERARDRYELDPGDFLKAEKRARELGKDIVGFYHSHPSHPAIASETDTEMAWPEYSYLIISVYDGATRDRKSWRLHGESMVEEAVAVD